LYIQVAWEDIDASGVEVSYRAKRLRGRWGTQKDVTGGAGGDPDAGNSPGHPSVTTFLSPDNHVITMVTYTSQVWLHNEYKSTNLDRNTGLWSGDFRFVSPYDDPWTITTQHPGKSGNMIANGDGNVFAAWPYLRGSNGSVVPKVIHYNVYSATGWGTAATMFGDIDTTYRTDAVCPCPLPDHNLAITFDRAENYTLPHDIFYTQYDFADDEFTTPAQITDMPSAAWATQSYVVCRDEGDGDYTLHLAWQEEYGDRVNPDSVRVCYTRYDGSWLSAPQVWSIPTAANLLWP
jgi:hypothetical protein